jgi:hypothetical protein
MVRRIDHQYFEGRALEAFELAKSEPDGPARSIYLKTAQCYHELARAIEERERVRSGTATPGKKH